MFRLRYVPFLLLTGAACGSDDRPLTGPDLSVPPAAAAATLPPFRVVTASASHVCALTTDNRAYCWGGAGFGATPVATATGFRWLELRPGLFFTCGLTTDSLARCWGNNSNGELGDGTGASSAVPVRVAGGRKYRQVRVGSAHACALTTANVAFCWGMNNNGQVGDGTRTNRLIPVRVAGALKFRQIRPGDAFTCGLSEDQRGWCWGYNSEGQLGDGSIDTRLKPTAVKGGHTFNQVSAGLSHACGVTTSRQAWCWGANQFGQLGAGSFQKRHQRPVQVLGGLSIAGVAPGGEHTCAVTTAGQGYCWGWNEYGMLGNGATLPAPRQRSPVPVVGGLQFDLINTSIYASCGVTTSARVFCWGATFGHLGDGSASNRSTPGPVAGG